MSILDDKRYANRRVTVMGLGRFGGGVGVVRYLLDQGARVTLTDLQSEAQLTDSLAKIDVECLESLVLGRHRVEDFTSAEVVVVNPAVNPKRNEYLQAALSQGVRLTSEIELFWEECPAKVIAVTGTVGKSTTASLIARLLRTLGSRTFLGGNIGISLLAEVDEMTEVDWVVLELSSFQLALLERFQPRPDVAVVTNLMPNHLDWHEDFADYRSAKQNVTRWQTHCQRVILNSDDPELADWKSDAERWSFGCEVDEGQPSVLMARDRFHLVNGTVERELPFALLPTKLNFPHLRENVATALAVVWSEFSFDDTQIAEALQSFEPLPHRFEYVGTYDRIDFINDSKATTPEATMAAVNSLDQPVILIAGGKDKHVDLQPMCESIAHKLRAVTLMGDTAESLLTMIREVNPKISCQIGESLSDCFAWAATQAVSGDVVLLSPACASHSEFRNYEDRGDQFRKLVANLIAR